MREEEFKSWIIKETEEFVESCPDNSLKGIDDSPMFERPLVGFAAGDDPVFVQLKTVIGEFHLTPREAMAKIAAKKGVEFPPEREVGIISYILPITRATRRENAGMTDMPSRRWAHTRCYGEQFNRSVQAHIVKMLEGEGCLAVAPQLDDDMFRIFVDDRIGYASTWSQRHVAFAAGHGTFGLCDGLITQAGKAHRVGSVVVNRHLSSPRRTSDIHADCLFFQGKGCTECARRCPAGAITEKGHDKELCREYSDGKRPIIKELYGIDIYGCGLCQTGVPCESRSPMTRTGKGNKHNSQ